MYDLNVCMYILFHYLFMTLYLFITFTTRNKHTFTDFQATLNHFMQTLRQKAVLNYNFLTCILHRVNSMILTLFIRIRCHKWYCFLRNVMFLKVTEFPPVIDHNILHNFRVSNRVLEACN